MSVETETHLTEVAARYRTAKFEMEHADTLHREAYAARTQAHQDLAAAEADLLGAQYMLEELASGDEPPADIAMAARELKAAQLAWIRLNDRFTRADGALADRDHERLQARHAAAEARKALYDEALHV